VLVVGTTNLKQFIFCLDIYGRNTSRLCEYLCWRIFQKSWSRDLKISRHFFFSNFWCFEKWLGGIFRGRLSPGRSGTAVHNFHTMPYCSFHWRLDILSTVYFTDRSLIDFVSKIILKWTTNGADLIKLFEDKLPILVLLKTVNIFFYCFKISSNKIYWKSV